MNSLYARSVFFTQDAEASLRHYTEQLGFSVDWKYDEEGCAYVFQVSLLGFELIVNQTEDGTRGSDLEVPPPVMLRRPGR